MSTVKRRSLRLAPRSAAVHFLLGRAILRGEYADAKIPPKNDRLREGRQEIFVDRVALAVNTLLFVHLSLEALALFDRISQFAKAVRKLDAAGVELEPLRRGLKRGAQCSLGPFIMPLFGLALPPEGQ